MTVHNILIVEDEPDAATRLKHLVGAEGYGQHLHVVIAKTFEDAEGHLRKLKFDLVFCDLLLLPPHMKISDGRITEGGAAPRPFSPSDWEDFVLNKGGIGLIGRLRDAQNGWNTAKNVLVVVTSYFDGFPGYRRSLRAIERYNNLILVPKYYRNPVFDDLSDHQTIKPLSQTFFQKLLSGDLEGATHYADQLRSESFFLRMEKISSRLAEIKDGKAAARLKNTFLVMRHNFDLVLEFDPRGAPEVDWDLVTTETKYFLSTYYEEWDELRNNVLLNPNVGIKFTLVASYVQGDRRPIEIPLNSLSPSVSSTGNINAHTMRSILRRRCILTYLASVAEPPQGLVDYGWSVADEDIARGAMGGYEKASSVDAKTNTIRWPGCDADIDLLRFKELAAGQHRAAHDIVELRDGIQSDLSTFGYKNRQDMPFTSEHVIVTPRNLTPNGKLSGYYFNGNLRLRLAEPVNGFSFRNGLSVPANNRSRRGEIFFFPMAPSQNFACLTGQTLTADQLQVRLAQVFDSVHRVRALAEVEEKSHQDDVLLCAPVDQKGFQWWLDNAQTDAVRKLLQKRVRIILAPESDATKSLSASVFSDLKKNGIHCIYTPGLGPLIPEAKVIDAIICTGYRLKYSSQKVIQPHLVRYWAPQLKQWLPRFRSFYSRLLATGFLGDEHAGSSSVRISDAVCLITASKTNKLNLQDTDLSCVLSYSPSYEEIRWVGSREPSSCAPWHAYIYRELPHVQAIVHTHNKAITYAKAAADFRTEEYIFDGIWQTGRQLVTQLQGSTSGSRPNLTKRAAVLRGHGEIVVGANFEDCFQALSQLNGD